VSPEAVAQLAGELQQARGARRSDVVPPTARAGGIDLDAAYEVERELSRRRRAEGRTVVGRKVGYANKAVWRALKLDTLVWADMYDDTVEHAPSNEAVLSIAPLVAPKIEPEIVFRLRQAVAPGTADPVAVLNAVEWIALGFEIIDCVYQDWRFQPADFVASYGLHAALVVGEPLAVDTSSPTALAEALATFQGSGRNSLRSPALCVAELNAAIARRAGADALAASDLISTGTLTESRRIAAGETWTAAVEGLALPALTLRTE
jgi:2-keto-4-pentenoate hydratase